MDDHVMTLISSAVQSTAGGSRHAAIITRLAQMPDHSVSPALEHRVIDALRTAWRRGRTPDELVWRIGRDVSGAEPLVRLAVSADREGWSGEAVHPRWAALLDRLDLPATEATGWLYDDVWARAQGWSATIGSAVQVVAAVLCLPPLPLLVPPPGGSDLPGVAAAAENAAVWAAGVGGDDTVLRRVRQLLAQAESTTFADEAATFTAKAHEIAARHAIDVASVWEGHGRTGRPGIVRIHIDDPYATPKSHLLQVVARHNHCRAVEHRGVGLTSVVGFPTDLRTTEMLFTSLLLQSQSELLALASSAPPGSHERTRGFRSSFLTGYAWRIDARLAEIAAAVRAEVAADRRGDVLLPAVVARDELVGDVFSETFSPRSRSVRLSDGLGALSGRAAADRASLDHRGLGGVRGSLGRAG